MLRRNVLQAGVLTLARGLKAQLYTPGPQVTTFLSDVDDSDQPYALYLPRKLDGAKKHPLVISLHEADSNYRLNLRLVFGRGIRPGQNEVEAFRIFPPLPDLNYIVACPLARGTMGYQGIAEKDVYDVLADVQKRFPIDEDRIYLTGLSMGGGGALWLGLTRPGIWAAVAPLCPTPPDGADELAPNALNFPVHLFHGEKDPLVSVDVSRKWQRNLLRLGVDVEYIEYPGVRHNVWDFAYKDAGIFDWFSKHRRNRFPDRVRFATRAYKYNAAYWVHFDGLTPGTLASIDARFTGANRIEIAAAGLDGFTLNLAGHPKFTRTGTLAVSIDGGEYKVPARNDVSFSRAGGKWKPGRYAPAAGEKRPGAEGPISEVVASRHVYVYGTADTPNEAELNRRREQALRAAGWSTPRRPLLLSLRAVADRDVTAEDRAAANLVLFGTAATNRLIASLQLPLEPNPGAADYGLVFVFPVDGRYVLVNSGLPWWIGAEQSNRPGLRYTGAPASVLPALGDYVLFKGSLNNVVAEGRFDRNWKLPAEDAAKLRATGAVSIR
jgi:predicted esterase